MTKQKFFLPLFSPILFSYVHVKHNIHTRRVSEQTGNQGSRIGKVILCTMKYCIAVSLFSNMHILSLTLRRTAVGLHLYLTPTFPVADHTVSPMLTLKWNVFCHKLAGLGSWSWGSACSGHRGVVIIKKTTNSTDKLLPEVTQRIL